MTGKTGGAQRERRRAVSLFAETRRALACVCGAVALLALLVPGAEAANRIYWSSFDGGKISYWNLDNSGGANIDTTGATVDGPMGMALDPAIGRVYWANWGGEGPGQSGIGLGKTISYANLGGGGGGTLPIAPAYVNGPHGLAIDPIHQKIYWPNFGDNTIGYANLDGTGAGHLNTSGTSINGPRGVTIDLAANRIYWANYGTGFGTSISYADLSGAGGGDLVTTGATVEGPEGIALDPIAGKFYWGNYGPNPAQSGTGDTIAYANLDGTGGAHDLATGGASKVRVHGVALDPAAGRIYWPNYGNNTLSSAALDGSGGANIPVNPAQATVNGPVLPTLLYVPLGTGLPGISGNAAAGSGLSCSEGGWAPDLVTALLYRAPRSFAYQWSRDGQPIGGATSSTYTPEFRGSYRCTVTAHNAAGNASQTSEALPVSGPPFKIGKLKLNKRKGTGKLSVKLPGPGKVAVSAGGKLKAVTKRAVGPGSVALKLKPAGKAKRKLARKGRVKLNLTVKFTPTNGSANKKRHKVTLIEHIA